MVVRYLRLLTALNSIRGWRSRHAVCERRHGRARRCVGKLCLLQARRKQNPTGQVKQKLCTTIRPRGRSSDLLDDTVVERPRSAELLYFQSHLA